MKLIDNTARLNNVVSRMGYRVAKCGDTPGYIKQVKLERAIKEYIRSKYGGDNLIASFISDIRNFTDKTLNDCFFEFEQSGIIEALFSKKGRVSPRVKAELEAIC